MISKEELIVCLREENYTEEQVQRALNGQISSVLNKGKVEKLHTRLQLLEELKIDKDKIIDGIAVLISGSDDNIRDNYKTLTADLGISQEGIENRLIILARGKKDKMQAIMQVLKGHNVSMEQINSCLTLLMENEADEIDKILTTLENHRIRANLLDEHILLLLLAKRKADEIEDVLVDIDEYNFNEDTIKNCLKLIYDKKGQFIKETAGELKKSNISQEMKERLLSDVIAGKLKSVNESIITLINCGVELDTIERDPIIQQNSQQINKVYTYLRQYSVSDNARESYLNLVSAHKWKAINDIFESLEKHSISREVVQENLENLLENAVKISTEIEDSLTRLEQYSPSEETMKTSLNLIFAKKGNQVQKTLNSIDTANTNQQTKQGLLPYLLARKSKQLDERLIMLANQGIDLDKITNSMPRIAKIDIDELQKRIDVLQGNEYYGVPRIGTINAIEILLKNTADEMNFIFAGLKEYEVNDETKNRCLKLMATARGKEIISIVKSLENHDISKATGKYAIDELLNSRPEVTEGVLIVLEKHNISHQLIEASLRQLVKLNVSPRRIDQTFTAYEKHGISQETIERTIPHLNSVRADEVDDTLTAVLGYGVTLEAVEKNINLLSEANSQDVQDKLNNLKTNGYYEIGPSAVESCMLILWNNEVDEIKAILKVFKDNNISQEKLEEYLVIVAFEKSKEIEEIFTTLKEYNLDYDTIDGCLRLMSTHKGSNIIDIVNVLKKHEISKGTIEGALKPLIRNISTDVDDMLTTLKAHKISQKTIEDSLKLLAEGYVKKDKVNKVLNAYEKHYISHEAIENAISGLGKAKIDEVDRTLTILINSGITLESIQNALNSLSASRADDVEARLNVLQNNEYYKIPIDAIDGCISVVTRNTPEEMTAILKVLHDNEIKEEAVKNCLSLLAYGNEKTVTRVLEIATNHGINIEDCMILLMTKDPERIERNLVEIESLGISREAILNCLSITGANDFETMKEVAKAVRKHNIGLDAIENCLSALSAGDAKDVDKTLTLLQNEKVRTSSIERALSFLALVKSPKVEAFITKLKNHNVDLRRALNNNLNAIVKVDIDEMDGMLDILVAEGLPIEENIGILSYTTEKRLGEIVDLMKRNKVPDETIAKELKSSVRDDGKLGIKIEDVFSETTNLEDRNNQVKKVRKYMRLMGMMGKHYTREEVESLCEAKNITVREFVDGVMCSGMYGSMRKRKNGISDLYYERIMQGKSVYIGPPKPIDRDYLEEHAEEVLKLADIAARRYLQTRQTPDKDELAGLAMEIIMNKCGNLVENLQDYPSALRGSIVSRASKYLYSVVDQNRTISITQRFVRDGKEVIKDNEYSHDVNGENAYEPDEELRELVDYEKAEFSQDETEIMEYMIRLIEEGEADDLYSKIAESFGMDEDEVLENIASIRKKMIQKGIVRENEIRGGFEFNRGEYEEDDEIPMFEDGQSGFDTEDFDM